MWILGVPAAAAACQQALHDRIEGRVVVIVELCPPALLAAGGGDAACFVIRSPRRWNRNEPVPHEEQRTQDADHHHATPANHDGAWTMTMVCILPGFLLRLLLLLLLLLIPIPERGFLLRRPRRRRPCLEELLRHAPT